jgi:proteic killer suppression protein
MKIRFESKKFEREVNDDSQLRRSRGDRQAKLIRRRLDELRAADTLADMRTLPAARCHELRGDRKGQISVDLDHPYRLLFQVDDPVPVRADGGLDWSQVVAIVVLGVEDTHD